MRSGPDDGTDAGVLGPCVAQTCGRCLILCDMLVHDAFELWLREQATLIAFLDLCRIRIRPACQVVLRTGWKVRKLPPVLLLAFWPLALHLHDCETLCCLLLVDQPLELVLGVRHPRLDGALAVPHELGIDLGSGSGVLVDRWRHGAGLSLRIDINDLNSFQAAFPASVCGWLSGSDEVLRALRVEGARRLPSLGLRGRKNCSSANPDLLLRRIEVVMLHEGHHRA